MRLTYLLVCKSWASNRLRTALTVLGIALGIALVVAIQVLDHNTIRSRQLQGRGEQGNFDFELVPRAADTAPELVLAQLGEAPGVADTAAIGFAPVAVRQPDGDAQVPALLHGLLPLPSGEFGHYVVADGRDLGPLDGDQAVLVGSALAEQLQLRLGTELELAAVAGPASRCRGGQRVPVDGESVAPAPRRVRVQGILAPERLGARALGMVVVGSFPLARALAPAGGVVYQVRRAPGANVDALGQRLVEAHVVADARQSMLGEAADERAFRNGVKVLGCLALVLGMFVVFQTLSQSLLERLRAIGILRCLGLTRRAIGFVFLAEASLLAALGALLGIGLGLLLAWWFQALEVSTLGFGKKLVGFEVPVGLVAWTAGLGVLFTLAGAWFPLHRARGVTALRVLSARGLEDGTTFAQAGVHRFLFVLLVVLLPLAYLLMTPLLAADQGETLVVLAQLGGMVLLFGGVLLIAPGVVRWFGRPLLWVLARRAPLVAFLADRSLARDAGRIAASVCGLAVVLLAYVGLEHLTASLRGEVEAFGAVAMDRRVFVAGPAMTPEVAATAATAPGVAQVTLFEGNVSVPFPLSGVRVDALARPGMPFAADPARADRYQATRSLVVSTRLAKLRRLTAGDFVAVPTDDGARAYEVLAVADAPGFFPDERAFAVTAPHWLREDFCVGAQSVERIAVDLTPDANPWQVMAALSEPLPQLNWRKTGAEIVAYLLRDVTRDFFLFEVLLALILGVSAVGLVNGMTLAALGRAREIGVLRALGMTGRTLRARFLAEGAVIACLAAALALVLSLPLGAVLVAGLGRVAGLDAPLVVPWGHLAMVPVFALLVGLATSLVPGWRIVREDPADAVRYE